MKLADITVTINADLKERAEAYFKEIEESLEAQTVLCHMFEDWLDSVIPNTKILPNAQTTTVTTEEELPKTLDELFAGYTGDYRGEEIDWGNPIGEEVW